MYREPIFLEPVFQERIWGGRKLKGKFNYEISSELIGECWGISAHPNGANRVKNGPFKGETLDKLWADHKELFGGQGHKEFPLLVKILDAAKDLSVQVHPDDDYARKKENMLYGKTECWYIIDCDEGAEIVYGHRAETRKELEQMVEADEWDKLLIRKKIHPGDFFYVPHGTIHAIGKGAMILETQQNSDITYRFYDYDRVDAKGNKRELHIDSCLEVTKVPHKDPTLKQMERVEGDLRIKQLIQEQNFTVYHWDLNGKYRTIRERNFLLFSVLDGDGGIAIEGKEYPLTKGEHFILPTTVAQYTLQGRISCIVSHN